MRALAAVAVGLLAVTGGALVAQEVGRAPDAAGTVTGRRLRLVDGRGNVRVSIDVADDGTVFVSGLDTKSEPGATGNQSILDDAAARIERLEDPAGMGSDRYRAFLAAAGWNAHNGMSLGLLLQQAAGVQRLARLNPDGAKRSKDAAAEIARLLRAGDGPGAAKALDGLRAALK